MAHEFEVALSFAGEDRAFAEGIATGLKNAGVKVFYDDFYAATLWGEDLSVRLREVYRDRSQFCIMVLSPSYVEKMWTNWERQQVIERLIAEKGRGYILPVRLEGFNGDVPGLPTTISYLSVGRGDARVVVDRFLEKTGRAAVGTPSSPPIDAVKTRLPKLPRRFTDQERNRFLTDAFGEVVDTLDRIAREAHREQPSFHHDLERVTSRKALFVLYNAGNELVRFKVWQGGSFGSDGIAFCLGRHLDVENDGTKNESASLVEHEGELRLEPLGMLTLGGGERAPMTPGQFGEYLWVETTRHFRV